jgi:hypothetical protein
MSVAAYARTIRAPPFLDPPGYARHRPWVSTPCRSRTNGSRISNSLRELDEAIVVVGTDQRAESRVA